MVWLSWLIAVTSPVWKLWLARTPASRRSSQTLDLGREGGRALRKAGLYLPTRNQHLSLSGGRAADLALHHCRARADTQPILVQQLWHLRNESQVHSQPATTHHSLET